MTPEEHNLISGLFDRLSQASSQGKDAEADQLIRSKVAEIPAAPYMLVQSLLVMQQAVTNAQSRIGALEKQLAEKDAAPSTQPAGGSFLAGVASLFGGGQSHGQPQRATQQPPPPPPAPMQPAQPAQQQPYGYPPQVPQPAARGGGFLQGALTTAAGVAGGALLFQGIEGLLGHNPGPFSGAVSPSGGLFGGATPTENTEIINNYYDQGDENRGQVDQQGTADQTAYTDPDPDPDPDPGTNDDYVSDNTDFGDDSGGGDDSTYV